MTSDIVDRHAMDRKFWGAVGVFEHDGRFQDGVDVEILIQIFEISEPSSRRGST